MGAERMENDLPKVKKTFYSIVVKRVLDVSLSGMAMIVLSPLLLVISALELKIHGKPILYCTKRANRQ